MTRIKHACHFSWQAQYLVKVTWKVKCHFSWQAQYLVKVKKHFWWQVQYLVKVQCHFSWQVPYLVKGQCHFSWQAQYLVKVKCHFSWQAQFLVKFGKIAGAPNVVSFEFKMLVLSAKSNLCCAAGCGLMGSWSDHGPILLGSAAHWKWRFSCFPQISARCWMVILRGRRSIWWVWRVTFVAPRIVNDVSNVTRIKHACFGTLFQVQMSKNQSVSKFVSQSISQVVN